MVLLLLKNYSTESKRFILTCDRKILHNGFEKFSVIFIDMYCIKTEVLMNWDILMQLSYC